MKGRPRKPSAILQLNGAFAEHPKRALQREGEPDVARIGPVNPMPPSWMDQEQAKDYHLLITRLHPDVACNADSMIVEALACLYADFRLDHGGKNWKGDKYAQLLRYCSALGMTPSDRSKVKVIGSANETKSTKVANVLDMF